MPRAAYFAAALADLWAAITAIQLYYSLNLQPGPGAGTSVTPSAQAPASVGDFHIFLTLVAAGGLYAAVALIYRHLHQLQAAAVAGAGNRRRLPDSVVVLLIAAVSLLEFFLFVQEGASAVVDVVGALGLAAFRAIPAAATATFFWGMMLMLIVVAHVRAGGEGGGGALAGDGQIQGPVRFITNAAFAAAAALVCLMAFALYAKY
ncbi:uncharacterized protein LOC120702933 [Panicum virgatum]|uniref:Uncharacterized protein n=1 Tax=Panicum virgatum TaxID=38727 RepID=A0A8T0TMV3_PANVG|nr:uncharacterized protein LOC120702933 [Panicum virgatum]KAG2610174.1 hypothetical protein PVAP13_4KG181100 [Panicum virgatum]